MVTFTACPVERLPEVLKFFADMYSPDYILARNEEFFKWQFGGAGTTSGGPSNGTLDLKLALVDNEVAGCVGYIPVQVHVAGRTVNAAWAANWMVDQKYRRLGLGPLLIRELASEFDVTLALGGNRDAHSLLPRMGWTDFGDLPRYVAVIDPKSAATLTESGSLVWPPEMLARALDRTGAEQAVKVDRFSDAVTDVWDRTYGDAAATRRSAPFLNWRYASHPVFDYRLFEVHGPDGALTGFAVYRVEQVRDLPVRIGRIVELVADDRQGLSLLRAMLQDGLANGVSAFDFFCSSPRIASLMKVGGFLLAPEEPTPQIPMLFQPVDRSRTGVLFMAHVKKAQPGTPPADWYVTTADGDQDRPS